MTLTVAEQFVAVGGGAGAVMLAVWALQLRTRDAGVVDLSWAACLGAAAIFAAVTGAGDPARRILVGVIGGGWGLRLALHLLFDRVLKGPEDGRYQMMREKFGPRVNVVFLAFFQAQAVLVVILCAPFLLACADPRPGPTAVDLAAAALYLVGLVGESIADRQLARFKHDPANRGGVCGNGLWRYSRHPNYFFEWVMWISYATVATGAPSGWLAWTAPALMLLFMIKLTGIPPTEARALKSRGDAYRLYQRTTSAFVPWFPKRHAPNASEISP